MKTVKLCALLALFALFSAAAVPAQEKIPEELGKVVFPEKLVVLVQKADTERPELWEAKVFLAKQ